MPTDNKAIVRQMEDVFNKGDIALVDQLYDPNFVSRTPSHPGTSPNRDGLKQQIQILRQAFPDGRYKIEDMVAEGDKVYVRWSMTGTHKGAYSNLAPSNKQITHYGQELLRLANGKIVERWGQSDNMEFEQKLK